MFEISDFIGMVLCLIVSITSFILMVIVSKKANSDLIKLNEERRNMELEYKYQYDKLVEKIENLLKK